MPLVGGPCPPQDVPRATWQDQYLAGLRSTRHGRPLPLRRSCPDRAPPLGTVALRAGSMACDGLGAALRPPLKAFDAPLPPARATITLAMTALSLSAAPAQAEPSRSRPSLFERVPPDGTRDADTILDLFVDWAADSG